MFSTRAVEVKPFVSIGFILRSRIANGMPLRKCSRGSAKPTVNLPGSVAVSWFILALSLFLRKKVALGQRRLGAASCAYLLGNPGVVALPFGSKREPPQAPDGGEAATAILGPPFLSPSTAPLG